MKKIGQIVLLLTLLSIFVSCTHKTSQATEQPISTNEAVFINGSSSLVQEESEPVIVLDDLKALLCANDTGTTGNNAYSANLSDGFFKAEETKKSGMERKTVTLFGKNQSVGYRNTLKYASLPYELDRYVYNANGIFIAVYYRSDTNSIVKFVSRPTFDPTSEVPVNAGSSEEDFVAYAKDVLLNAGGVSTDGWNVRVERTDFPYREEGSDRFVRGYIIKFYKMIADFERSDSMVVKITDAGEILEFNAINYGEAFEPFMNVKPERAKIEEAVFTAYGEFMSYPDYEASISDMTLFPKGGALWAEVTIMYQTQNGVCGGISFMVEVARIKNAPSNSPINQMPANGTPATAPVTEYVTEPVSEPVSEPATGYVSEYAPPESISVPLATEPVVVFEPIEYFPGQDPYTTAEPATTFFILEETEPVPSSTTSP